MTAPLAYRRARPSEYAAIVDLNERNFIANLSADERKQGFLSARFSLEQTARIAEDLGTMVALADDTVVGFLCAFRNEFETGSPVIAKMLASYDRLSLSGKPLSSFKSYIYGPVCIARDWRGQGVLRGLYEAQRCDLAGRFEIGVAFVARDNGHSLSAHVAGLGMAEAGNFEVGGKAYAALAFRLPAAPK